MFTPQQTERLAELVESALDLPPEQQREFVRQACAPDDALRARIEALLGHQGQVGDFMETPVFRLDASTFLDGSDEGESDDAERWGKGTRLGDHVIGDLLGEGGMGEVYLAEDTNLRRHVAVKVVRHGFGNGGFKRRFQQEARILATLTHPNIARLYDSGATTDGTPYFILEYVEGERLDAHCRARKLSVEDRLALFRKICAAVNYAHQNLVVHRDLKPANILVTAEGEPKLLDFGIAKLLETETVPGLDAEPTLTLPGVMTRGYASPEQARGEAVTTASDVYSLGVLLHELLSGQRLHPCQGLRPDEVIRLICETTPERPSMAAARVGQAESVYPASLSLRRLRLRLAGDLDNIVSMALRKEPARRYATVAQFSEDIRRHLVGLPVLARRDTFRYRAGKFVGRNKAGVAAGAFVLLALMAGLIAATWEARIARRQRDRAERRFADVRRLSNALLFDIAPKMERLEGSLDARRALVQRAQEYLDSLALEASGDPALLAELAAAYVKVGELRGDPLRPNLSDFPGAVASYEKAGRLLRGLLVRRPDDPGLLSAYGASLSDLSRVRDWSGNMQGALDDAQAAREVYDRLFQLVPGSAHERASAAEALIQVARRHYLNEELPQVYPPLRAAIDTLETLRRTQPDGLEIPALLGRARTLLGITLSWDGKQAEGEAEMTQAFALTEGLVAAHPRDSVLRQGLLSTYEQGSQLYEGGDDERSHEIALKALALAERASGEDPANVQARQNLAKSLLRVGTLALRLHRDASAVAALTRAQDLFSKLEDSPRSALSNQIDLGMAEAALGEAWAEQGKFDDALASFRQAVGRYEAMARADPANKMPIRKLANVYNYIGTSQRAYARTLEGERREAETRAAGESYQRALDCYAQLQAKQAMTPYDQKTRQEVQKSLTELTPH